MLAENARIYGVSPVGWNVMENVVGLLQVVANQEEWWGHLMLAGNA